MPFDSEYYEDEFEDDEPPLAACPHCQAMIYDDAVRCNECGEYIIEDTSSWSGKTLSTSGLILVIIIVVVVLLAIVLMFNRT